MKPRDPVFTARLAATLLFAFAFSGAAAGAALPSATSIAISVDPEADRRPVSPWIYGVNFGEIDQWSSVPYPVRRWGGNATTRYNWQLDLSAKGSDWFFFNIPGSGDPDQLPDSSDADLFIDETRAAGAEVVLTLPTIGWTAGPDREKRWSFSQALYGPQTLDECRYFGDPPPFWCQPDAGNGECDPEVNTTPYCQDGLIVGNDPTDTALAIGPDFASAWIAHLAARVGSAAEGGVRFFALDNEPMLWNSTHRDVHPEPATYDEVWSQGVAVAGAARAADPGAQLLGPDTWGWCDLFTSAADAALGPSCLDGPDRQAHGGLPFVEWYLAQARAHELATGNRVLDFLDVHFYPQGGVAGTGGGNSGEDPTTAARRLRSVKELYDPTYVSESWIGEPVYLIPRLKQWIADAYPGLKLAITEYKWGSDSGATGALAQAEVLAIFGREGVDLATRWVAPQAGSKAEDAFRLYLNYDGAGAAIAGESVRALSADLDAVGAYALRDASGRLFVLLFNKDTAEQEAQVAVAGGVAGPVALFGFDADQPLGSRGIATPSAQGFTLTLPARSARLAVALLGDFLFADGFESGDAAAWSTVAP